MKQDSEFVFLNSIKVIAFVCDMSVYHTELCHETYLNLFRHPNLPLDFTVGILATKESFLD